MKPLCVLSGEIQYQKLIEKGFNPKDFTLLCDNAQFYDFLKSRGIGFEILDEFLIRSRWQGVNAWGCEKASELIRAGREETFFREVDLATVVFHRFSYLLIHLVKNYLYAKEILQRYAPMQVVVFEPSHHMEFPDFSGNVFLNEFLSEFSEQKKIRVERIKISGERVPSGAARPAPSIKERVRKILGEIYARGASPPKKVDVLAVGSLKHLARAILALKKRGWEVGLYDFEFHKEFFIFALRDRISYLLANGFTEGDASDRNARARDYKLEFLNVLKFLVAKKEFVFDSYEFGGKILRHAEASSESYFRRLSQWRNQFENLWLQHRPLAVLLEEDITDRGAFSASFFKSKGIPSYCVCHALSVVNFSVSEKNRVFGPSLTFMNSLFEKEMYESRGWDSSRIVVTGSPRLDRLAEMSQKRNGLARASKRFRLLYCGATMKTHWPDKGGFLGIHIVNMAQIQQETLKALLRAIEGLRIELVVKPHDFEGRVWNEFFEKERVSSKVKIEKHTADFFKLLLESDAMVLGHWSTAIIEAAICGVPTILVDLLRSEGTDPYAKLGLCRIARSQAELRSEIERIVCGEKPRFRNPKLDGRLQYYLGPSDGQNNSRVVAYIEKTIREKAVTS